MRRLAALTIAAFMAITMAMPAVAASYTIDFSIRQRRGPLENAVVPFVATPQLAGLECLVTVTTGNNHSVHDTDVVVRSNADQVTVRDMESAPNLTRTATDLLTVRDGIGVIVIAYDDGATSITGTVTLECKEPPSSTTTTSTSPPTTSSSVPTTTSSTTSTTSSSTSTPEESTTSSTSTSVPPASTTTAPTSTTPTSSPPSSTTTAQTGSSTLPSELPHTGATGAGTIAAAALALLGLGGLSVRAGRRES